MQSLTFLQACSDFNLKPEFITAQEHYELVVEEMMAQTEFTPLNIIKFNKFITEHLRLVELSLRNKTFVSALTSLPEEYMSELHKKYEDIPVDVLKKVLTSMLLLAKVFNAFDELDVSEPVQSLCWLKLPTQALGASPLKLILSGDESSKESIFKVLSFIESGDFAAM